MKFHLVLHPPPHRAPQEESILKYWNKTDAFKEQLRRSEGRPEYVFYDGPPFATGLPHYGHILAGTIKDVVTRFACSTGHHVTRRFGWDCHGLPVEYEIDKKLGIRGKADVLKLGIDKYNEVEILRRKVSCCGLPVVVCGEHVLIVFHTPRASLPLGVPQHCHALLEGVGEDSDPYRALD